MKSGYLDPSVRVGVGLKGGQQSTTTLSTGKSDLNAIHTFLLIIISVVYIWGIFETYMKNGFTGFIIETNVMLFAILIIYTSIYGYKYLTNPNGNGILKIIIGVLLYYDYPIIILSGPLLFVLFIFNLCMIGIGVINSIFVAFLILAALAVLQFLQTNKYQSIIAKTCILTAIILAFMGF